VFILRVRVIFYIFYSDTLDDPVPSDSFLYSSLLRSPDCESTSDKESSSPNQASTPTFTRPKQSSTSQSLRRRVGK